jgi:hypothetical protein
MIQDMIKEGKIVPSEVTIKLLDKAMKESENDKFLIDGFPRNEENRAAFEEVVNFLVLLYLSPRNNERTFEIRGFWWVGVVASYLAKVENLLHNLVVKQSSSFTKLPCADGNTSWYNLNFIPVNVGC